MRIARDAWSIVLPLALAAVAAGLLGWTILTWALVILVACVLAFFRDPRREVPGAPDLVVAPADGKIVGITPTDEGELRVSIFMSVFDVHVNRAPVAGRVTGVHYHKGMFLPAFRDKASLRNEQNRIELDDGTRQLAMVQIAGLVARRIVCRVAMGDWLERGQRLGLIKFGSRVDLYLPQTIELQVHMGDRVRGGSSVIGRLVGGDSVPAGNPNSDRPSLL
ncbi:MAG: phosphatidylserine decarboxylase family protein [Acidobacteria bacterium]|nr:MAG: phosphatidylserine decarboxylase family protein [Acidobacteriota bacterium]